MKLHENPSFTNIVDTKFMKTRPVGAELSTWKDGRTDGQADSRRNKANSRFSLFCEHA